MIDPAYIKAGTVDGDLISRQAAIDVLADMYHAAERWGEEATDGVIKARAESCMASLVEMKLRIENLPSAQPDRSLWFRIGEVCVGESKGDISAEMAVEKMRELLREAERRKE